MLHEHVMRGQYGGQTAPPHGTCRTFDSHGGSMSRGECFAFALFSSVALTKPLETEEGTLPVGSVGVALDRLGSGAAYIVEFFQPLHTVEEVRIENLRGHHR